MLGAIGLVLLAAVVLLVIIVATRPDKFRYERRTTIAAPAPVIFGLLNDFHQWTRWSPWEGRDPSMTRTHAGAPSGSGAVYSRVGNSKVGEGRMTITESLPSQRIAIKLEFIKPWTATNLTEFTVKPTGGGSDVTWAMSGSYNFMAKAFSLFMNMDKLIGKDFEQGLAQLKGVAETESKGTGVMAAATGPGTLRT
jgi:hypothetical protein